MVSLDSAGRPRAGGRVQTLAPNPPFEKAPELSGFVTWHGGLQPQAGLAWTPQGGELAPTPLPSVGIFLEVGGKKTLSSRFYSGWPGGSGSPSRSICSAGLRTHLGHCPRPEALLSPLVNSASYCSETENQLSAARAVPPGLKSFPSTLLTPPAPGK